MSIFTEVLAGAWERLEQGRADIVIAPDMHFRASSEINTRKLYKVMSVYVAAPDHPIHQEPEPLSEVTRVKYRGIAVADTARERPVLTVQLLDKQQRLTVSTIEDKRLALLAGLGVATMPYPMVGERYRSRPAARGGAGIQPRSRHHHGLAARQHGGGEGLVPARNSAPVRATLTSVG
ncbi:putative DNA-binding transcriptional regulator [Serratia marcescens]|uniref:Putative DNA-binding transcriptional regulator n=1 Tax=Serratia marcescens TaxID=615 RepID=A0A379YFV4_SERMA|nr:putative DNA-binding transcriptional regulator [Serratia marcescens]